MKRLFFLLCVCMLFCSSFGCEIESDSDQNGTATTGVSLATYSAINHTFLNNLIGNFRTTGNVAPLMLGVAAPVQGEITGALKLVGKVVQIAHKVHSHEATKNYHSNVLGDLDEIQAKLDKLNTNITAGFNLIVGKLDELAFNVAWNALVSDHFVHIDAAWKYYLDPNGRIGLVNKLSSNSTTFEDFENAVTVFKADMSPERLEDIDNALTAIQGYITGYPSYPQILDLYVTALSSNSGTTFDNEDTMKELMTRYLYMYSNLVLYQTKALILLDEYYNLQLEDDGITLNATGYTTVTSDESKGLNADAVDEFQKQLVPFLNSGEKLISQFNSGDIYRKYETTTPAIGNSVYYPYIDSYIKTFYGDVNGALFVFRLVWSEEAATNDPDAVIAGETVSGYTYDYPALFSDLKDAAKELDFRISDNTGNDYLFKSNDLKKNLTGISIFTLHPQGRVDISFNAGLRRFVFLGIPKNSQMHLSYTTDLVESYTFNYTPNGSKSYEFKLYDPESTDFSISDLLAEKNPLESMDYDYACVSYTFGAYMADFEYKNMYTLYNNSRVYDSLLVDASNLYNTSSEHKYYMTSTLSYVEIDTNEDNATFFFLPINRDEPDNIYDGEDVYLRFVNYRWNYTNSFLIGAHKCKSGEVLKESYYNDVKYFTLKKKYIFPSGKLFSDNVIKRYTFFMLTKTNDLWVHHMASKHDYRLELSKDGDSSMSTWFFLDDSIDTGQYL